MAQQRNSYFNDLIDSFKFPDMKYGKTIVTIVSTNTEDIPLVRTTTQSKEPVQQFSSVIYTIIYKIKQVLKRPDLEFNNGMVELYTSYKYMGWHTDQGLDLKKNSSILLFSCYEDPSNMHRILRIKNKETKELHTIKLENNEFVLFSTDTNSKYLHQIVLDDTSDKIKLNRWCGVTLRLSKTYIRLINEKIYFTSGPLNGTELIKATDQEIKEFYKMKGEENILEDYKYKEVSYSISDPKSHLLENLVKSEMFN